MSPESQVIREIKLTNSLSGKKEPLAPRAPGKLTMYSCGPTVWNMIHIGNLRTALHSDMIFRYFRRAGYDVTFVRNYTDVDDKIIKRAADEKIPVEEVTKKYITEVEKDYAVAGMLEPTHKPRVTAHMPEIVALIGKILANKKAYIVDGEVLFAIDQFKPYGKLSHRNIDDLIAGIRVEVNSKKKNPLDFTLWKPAKPGEPTWESPWSQGRPGWHIECSAMAGKWLGEQIDIHHGGEDLTFPHHENEIAQSEGANGKDPFVRYWLHSSMLTISKEKMSKSVGNVFIARDFLTRFSGEFARYLLLSAHYRTVIDFGPESIEQALIGLHRIYEAKARAQGLLSKARARADLRAEGAWGEFVASCEAARREIDDHFANDFNAPGALGTLFTLIREFNRTLAEPLAQATPSGVLGAQELIRVIEEDIGGILGVGRQDAAKGLADLAEIRKRVHEPQSGSLPTEDEIQAAIRARADARQAKDFAKADQIRKDLDARGVAIKDGSDGTSWEYK